MTQEQRERARRLIEDEIDEWELSADGASFDRRHESRSRANADALRAVLAMLEAEPVGWARWYEETGVIGTLVYRTIEQTGGVPVVPVVALLPVREGDA